LSSRDEVEHCGLATAGGAKDGGEGVGGELSRALFQDSFLFGHFLFLAVDFGFFHDVGDYADL
jgi:hypothetical protein